jgi:hypothetical protein
MRSIGCTELRNWPDCGVRQWAGAAAFAIRSICASVGARLCIHGNLVASRTPILLEPAGLVGALVEVNAVLGLRRPITSGGAPDPGFGAGLQ